jgi:hypothetical protein
MPMVNKVSFREVTEKAKEVEMYDPLVHVLRSMLMKDAHGA